MKTIKDLINIHKGKNAIVIGAGATLIEYQKQIDNFIKETAPIIIGVNNMTSFWIPDYHMWTNNQRFRTYGKNIDPTSTILLGSNISLKVIKEVIDKSEYVVLNRVDREGVPIKYKNGTIYGYFRTAGCLAIMILHLMGVDKISVIGMDGYTLYNQHSIETGKKSQHCYGKGFTDTATWKTCIKKDEIIDAALQNIQNYGIDFKIITPTKYKRFYDSTTLGMIK